MTTAVDIDYDEGHRRQLADRFAEVSAAAHDRCNNAFPRRYIDAHTDLPDVLDWVKQFRADAANAPSLLLLGPTGTGKTWQAYAALRQAVTYPQPARGVGYRAPGWKATTHADLLASMRPSPRNDSEQVLKELRDLPLLFVDDLGVAKNSEWVEDITYRLINGRYEQMMPSIFTSNLAVNQLKDALGDRVASRLAETTIRVVLNGADRRRQPKEA
jgi:DNA replication protein DnaC